MRLFGTAVFLLTLATTVTTAPTSPAFSPLPLHKRVNNCGGSTFVDQTNNNAAKVEDCQLLLKILEQPFLKSFGWEVGSTETEILTTDTCTFTSRATARNAKGTVGNEDAFDLIRDSIAKYQRNGRVAARGIMPCGGVEMEWRVKRLGA